MSARWRRPKSMTSNRYEVSKREARLGAKHTALSSLEAELNKSQSLHREWGRKVSARWRRPKSMR